MAHKPLRTRSLYTFLFIWTIVIFGIVVARVVLSSTMMRSLYDAVPPIHYLLVTIGVEPDSIPHAGDEQKRSFVERLSTFLSRKQSGKDTKSDHRLTLQDDASPIRLYSPTYMFQGQVSSGVSYIHMYYEHPARNIKKELVIDQVSEDNTWQYEVGLDKQTIFNGINVYTIEVVFADGKKIEREVTLTVDYQRMEIGESIVYLDPHFIPEWSDEDLLMEINDFEWNPFYVVTYGCDTAHPHQWILIEHAYQFDAVSACITFSLKKQYVLQFQFRERQPEAYLYDILWPGGEVIVPSYPLYVLERWSAYLWLVFWDKDQHLLKSIRALGDLLRYEVQIDWYDTLQQIIVAKIRHIDGHTLSIETQREKEILYMYKERDNYYSLAYPWLRYQYFTKGIRDTWRKISEWTLGIPQQTLYAPGNEKVSTFWFSLAFSGDLMEVNDGIYRSQLSIFQLSQKPQTNTIIPLINQPSVCDGLEANFYEDSQGHIITQSPKNTILFVGKWACVSQLSFFHNGETVPYTFDSVSPQCYFHTRLSRAQKTLVSGENIYTLIARDQRWQEICRKEFRFVQL